MIGLQTAAAIEAAIQSSWSRCEQRYNLKRDAGHPILRLQSTEVAPRLEAMTERAGGRHGIFKRLAHIAAEAGHCLVITDSDGILVRLESKDAGEDWNGITLGSVWDERIAGTNGVSMALSENQGFTVRGSDHYYAKLRGFACTAIPLRDAQNDVIGVANLSSIDSGNPTDALFARQLLSAAASRLQHTLFQREFNGQAIVSIADPTQKELVRGSELVAVNESGMILGATMDAHSVAGLSDRAEIKGQSFDAVFGTDLRSFDHEPGKILSSRRDQGPLLDLWVRAPTQRARVFPGWRPKSDLPRLPHRLPPSLKDLCVGSGTMETLCQRARNCVEYGLPLLVEGETGTGKSSLISALTDHVGHVVTVDFSKLKGAESDGAYINALVQQMRFANEIEPDQIQRTVLLLENLDETPNDVQAELRSALDSLEARGELGGARLQIIATSRVSVRDLAAMGAFRDDLYFLLAGAVIAVPPLRVRENPVALAKVLLQKIAGREVEIAPSAEQALAAYHWPGNIRELRNALTQALLNGDGHRITAIDLTSLQTTIKTPCKLQSFPVFDEEAMIVDALQGARWNVSKAARTLGMGRATIHRKMKAFGISRPS